MSIDVDTLDQQIEFLHTEAAHLRHSYGGRTWAQQKANKFDDVKETLRKVRQQIQMTGLNGEVIR